MISGLYKYIVFDPIERSTGKVYDQPCHRIMGHHDRSAEHRLGRRAPLVRAALLPAGLSESRAATGRRPAAATASSTRGSAARSRASSRARCSRRRRGGAGRRRRRGRAATSAATDAGVARRASRGPSATTAAASSRGARTARSAGQRVDAVRRAVERPGVVPVALGDRRRRRASRSSRERPRREPQQVAVAVAVDRDRVAGGATSRGERRVARGPARRRGRTSRARPPRRAPSSTAGVPCGCGPSSNVIATAPGTAHRVGTRSAAATRGTIGASAGTAQAAAVPRREDARRRASQAPAGAAASSRTASAARGRAAKDRSGSTRRVERPPHLDLEQRRGAGHRREPEALVRAVVDPDVRDAPAVGDRPGPAHLGLEHGQPRGRVDEHVGGGEVGAHRVGEALDAHERVARERALQPRPQAGVGPAQADDGRAEAAAGARGALDVAEAPAPARDQHELPRRGQAERRAGRGAGGRVLELRPRQAADVPDVGARAGDLEDLGARLGVDDRGAGPSPGAPSSAGRRGP